MAEIKGKIIKKTVSSAADPEYSNFEGRSSLIEGEVYEASQVAKDLLSRAQAQANEIVEQARNEAGEILAKAQEKQEQLHHESQENGHQEGLAKAAEYVARAEDYYRRSVERSKDELKILAVKISEKIIGRALELDPAVIRDIVSQAIRTLRQHKSLTVRCCQEDYDALKQNEGEFLNLMSRDGTIHFNVDSSIPRGGCIVESEAGIVDARLETQLKTLQKVLFTR